ncbi:MAG TPA: GLPGLI family protein [Moheibacter sp.]|nr:GLPGLI family protein [Moheibacter sp.]
MRYFTFTIFALLCAGFLSAQDALVVDYEMYTKINLDDLQRSSNSPISNKEWQDAMEEAMAKPSYYQLTLTPEESIYEYVEKIDNQQKDEGRRVMVRFGSQGKLYKNLNENLTLKEANNFNSDYLINDTIANYDWKITRETKEVLGYETRKATAVVDSTRSITAWYAPKLAFKNGPESLNGLPGLILQAEVIQSKNKNTQTQTYTAIALNVGNEKTKIQRPKKGKKVTNQEFKIAIEKQMEKMKEMRGDGVDKD